MKCVLPDLTEEQNTRILQILQETRVLGDEELSPELCTIQTSKKNIVVAIHPQTSDAVVLKLFASSQSLQNEVKIYTQLTGSIFHQSELPHVVYYAIPELLFHGEDYIITKHIDGFNGMEIITKYIQDEWNPLFWEQICTDLIQWVIHFSEKTHLIPLDCHVRNFILLESTIYGVDFEELTKNTYENIISVLTTIYFSILGAYPGVIEGLELDKKADLGIIFLRRLLLNPQFQQKSLKEIVESFLVSLQMEAAKVVQRRLNRDRGKGYDTEKIKENLDFVISRIQSDFD
jgi:hypothetical protein